MEELKPCPFCGRDASAEGKVNYKNSLKKKSERNAWWADGTPIDMAYFCNCMSCGASNQGLLGHRTKAEAIEQWNTRTPPPSDSEKGR